MFGVIWLTLFVHLTVYEAEIFDLKEIFYKLTLLLTIWGGGGGHHLKFQIVTFKKFRFI